MERLRVRIPAGMAGEFVLFRANFQCGLLLSAFSIPVLPQWYANDPGHSAKSAAGRLFLNTHLPLIQRSRSALTVLSLHTVGTFQRNELTCTSLGNAQPQSSQLAEPLRTDSGFKRGTSVRQPISIKKKKSAGGD